ncbi:hypothetical protein E0K89_011730 [Aquicoccus sp. SCR17]|nr:hypothetical protein [Carideicomes alvinocaridis]
MLPILALALSACAATPEDSRPRSAKVAELAAAIQALGPDVDPEEAERAARVSYAQARHLTEVYEITDPPIIHNAKVNMGLKPRGLCWHWAEDMENRLAQEDFKTLDLHRAIANSFKTFRIDHSTVIVSAKGDDMFEGIVLDPWRKGGKLTWLPTLEDPDYDWAPRQEVFARKRERKQSERLAQGNLFRPAVSTSE